MPVSNTGVAGLPEIEIEIEIVPGSPLLEAEVDGEIVGLSLEQDVSFGFNRTGSFIWSQLQQPIRMDELLKRVQDRFDVTADQCEAEVRSFIDKLAGDGLVTIREDAHG